MILLLGDIHGDAGRLHTAIREAEAAGAKAVIQVGDFGLYMWGRNRAIFQEVAQLSSIPVYFIEGNHDDCSYWVQHHQVTKLFEDGNLYYVPRGTVMQIDGRTIAFLGGAASIDKNIRLKEGWHWDAQENIREQDVQKLLFNAQGQKIDIFITHDVPLSVCNAHFDPKHKLWFGVPLEWEDPNMHIIEDVWEQLGKPQLYSGHMHRRVVGDIYRILDINETLLV